MIWAEGRHIATGSKAVVTCGPEGVAVKTFDAQVPLIATQIEAAGARAASNAGLPAPRFLGFDEGPPAQLAMAYVDAPPLMHAVPTRGARFVGEELARCQQLIRAARVPLGSGVFRVAALLAYQLGEGPLPAPQRAEFQSRLNNLPEADTMCHMDLQPCNVLWDGKRSIVIDWLTARIGPPAADVARTRVVLEALRFDAPADVDGAAFAAEMLAGFEEQTRKDDSYAWEQSDAWIDICRAARLHDDITKAERESLMAAIAAA